VLDAFESNIQTKEKDLGNSVFSLPKSLHLSCRILCIYIAVYCVLVLPFFLYFTLPLPPVGGGPSAGSNLLTSLLKMR
jgi:hypothetical protein